MNQPDFIIIGAPKGGTTSLYHYLRQHPQISMAGLKDSHFFLHDGSPPIMGGPSDQHRRREMIKTWSDYQNQFWASDDALVKGEIGVRYLDSSDACTRIRQRLPNVKLIAILRHPVDRAYSHYHMYRRNGSEPCASFEQALADQSRRLREGWFRGVHQHLGYYHQHLLPYFDQFDRQQIKIYLFDDLQLDPQRVMRDLYGFLGVDADFDANLSNHYNQAGKLANPLLRFLWSSSRGLRSWLTPFVPISMRGHMVRFIANRSVLPQPHQPLAEITRKILLDTYRDDIQQLSKLIERDLSHWLAQPVESESM